MLEQEDIVIPLYGNRHNVKENKGMTIVINFIVFENLLDYSCIKLRTILHFWILKSIFAGFAQMLDKKKKTTEKLFHAV